MRRANRSNRFLVAIACLLLAGNAWLWLLVPRGPGRLVVTFLDVGQGDAIVVQGPSGRVLLVDTGPGTGLDDAGRRVVLPFLRSQGIGAVDGILLTHPHDDHVGGAASILERVDVGRLLVGTEDSPEPAFKRVIHVAHDRGVGVVRLRRSMALNLGGGASAEVLNPSDAMAISPNNGSIGLRIHYGATAIVLAGDAEAEAEADMVQACDLHADVLKLSHHGSRSSSTQSFLQAVAPHAAVLSVGAHNVFGHPSSDVLERLEYAGTPVFRTDLDGAIIVESDGRNLAIRRTKRPDR